MSFEDTASDLDVAGRLNDPKLRREFCLRLVETLPLPNQEAEWLDVARRYANKRATEMELEAARVAAWTALGTRSCDFSDPAVNRVRAVICTLFADASRNDALDEIINVEEFFRGAGGAEEESTSILQSVFARHV